MPKDLARDALAAALPTDPDDGTVVLGFEDEHGFSMTKWGRPETAADAILAKLAAKGWTLVNPHRELRIGNQGRAVCAADGLPWPCKNSPEGDTP